MFINERVLNLLKTYFFNKYFFLICGALLAYISSIEVLDLNSNFWLNDQGKFFNWGNQKWYLYHAMKSTGDISKDFPELKLYPEYSFSQFLSSLHYYARYKLFSTFIRGYFLLFNDPFLIVFLHKLLLIIIFTLCFHNGIIKSYGLKIFLLLFLSFSYLNLFF